MEIGFPLLHRTRCKMEVSEVPYSDSIKIEPIYDGNDTISQDGNETMLSDEEKGNLISI